MSGHERQGVGLAEARAVLKSWLAGVFRVRRTKAKIPSAARDRKPRSRHPPVPPDSSP